MKTAGTRKRPRVLARLEALADDIHRSTTHMRCFASGSWAATSAPEAADAVRSEVARIRDGLTDLRHRLLDIEAATFVEPLARGDRNCVVAIVNNDPTDKYHIGYVAIGVHGEVVTVEPVIDYEDEDPRDRAFWRLGDRVQTDERPARRLFVIPPAPSSGRGADAVAEFCARVTAAVSSFMEAAP